jgi:hypothetical protein
MIERRVTCDRCGGDCTDGYETLEAELVDDRGAAYDARAVQLCPECLAKAKDALGWDKGGGGE